MWLLCDIDTERIIELITATCRLTKKRLINGGSMAFQKQCLFSTVLAIYLQQSKLQLRPQIYIPNFRPQVLPSLVRNSNLSQLRPYLIQEYLSKRSDFYTNSINRIVCFCFTMYVATCVILTYSLHRKESSGRQWLLIR
jgi:hypothetical protein